MTEKLDELEGREEECLYDFERNLDAAFWDEWEAAMLPTDAQIESWTMRTAEENVRVAGVVLHSVAEDGSSTPPVPGLKGVDWNARIGHMMALADELPPPTSTSDYAAGYEAGMADAALIAGRYLDGADAAVVRGILSDPMRRVEGLK